ncbi:hypothetical protein [Pseudoalteromonas sp. bablab_jr004]|uniref:hypothetical protein n=1 Tax=Pseudoalteromonas sp. bablab_jr004 TaxID=2755065 RepID=UPI0018F47C1C|nr:hypothetical protein [Pseudoalteromonas sp. bablab_jr004]
MKAYSGVKAYYYKKEAAIAVLDHAHALRNGFTQSQNVVSELSHENLGFYYHESNSSAEAFELMFELHKQVTGKKVRRDNNALFEHVVWLSEHQYSRLEMRFGQERVKKAFLQRLKRYAESVRQEFGFEPLGIDVHMDEGHINDSGKFIRNIHAHVAFFNYDFLARRAPLRHMMKKGRAENGKTNSANPNFEMLQNLVHEQFKGWGFSRGTAKSITGREHLQKEDFVKEKLQAYKLSASQLTEQCGELEQQLKAKEEKLSLANEAILQKKQEYKWLTEQVTKLSELKRDMSKAITQGCRAALASILGKQAKYSVKVTNKPR